MAQPTQPDSAEHHPTKNLPWSWEQIVLAGFVVGVVLFFVALAIGNWRDSLRLTLGWASGGLAVYFSVLLTISWLEEVLPRNTIVILASFSVGLCGSVLWIAFEPELTRASDSAPMTDENHSTVLQFFILVALGGAISTVHQQFEQTRNHKEVEKQRERDRKEAEKLIVLRIADDLLDAYNRAKRVRQILRARVLRAADRNVPLEQNRVPVHAYDEQMEALVDAQLAFESMERRMRASSNLFQDRYAELVEALNSIGDHLLGTLEEYEDQRTEFGAAEDRALTELPVLMRFLGVEGNARGYDARFERPFHTAVRVLRSEVQRRSFVDPGEPPPMPSRSERVPWWVLGSREGEVRVTLYQERWKRLFERENQRLTERLNEVIDGLHHIGSTAVPGLAAEPILDLLLEVPSISEEEAYHKILFDLRYEDIPELRRDDRIVYCRWEEDRRTHLLTIAESGSAFSKSALRLREFLREDVRARRTFQMRQLELGRCNAGNADEYRLGFEQLVNETLARAGANEEPS